MHTIHMQKYKIIQSFLESNKFKASKLNAKVIIKFLQGITIHFK